MDLTTLSAFALTIATATTDKPGRPQKRRLPVLCLRLLAGVASLGKSPVRCHEQRQHWCNQLDWITDRLTALEREELGIDDEVPEKDGGHYKETLPGMTSLRAVHL